MQQKPKQPKQNKIVGQGWVGVWCDGSLGWRVSPYLTHGRSESASRLLNGPENYGAFPFALDVDDRVYRCKITVQLLRDRRGRLISRAGKAPRRV